MILSVNEFIFHLEEYLKQKQCINTNHHFIIGDINLDLNNEKETILVT